MDNSTKKTDSSIEEEKLVKDISESSENKVVETTLKTDQRVIARVTDGIYRQPSSALRELISNAYDADATRVVIKTDAPRFERMSIEDDGHGMTPEALAHMLMHIGGSAKRHESGKALGVTSLENSSLSPNGRKLIGKIGIGIFSVAQLTYHFQIITKTKGDLFRTIATVALKQYSDNEVNKEGTNDKYESGKVNIWREKADDVDAHGTRIVLTNIRPQAKETLQSKEIWAAIEQSEQDQLSEDQTLEPPKFHIGRVLSNNQSLKEIKGNTHSLPWEDSDSPSEAFKKLVESVWDELNHANAKPKLDKIFDYYLQMVWTLGLSVPVPYVAGHIFDLELADSAFNYLVANVPKGSAKELELKPQETLRESLNLIEGKNLDKFDVLIDDLQLLRPIKFKDLPTGSHALKKPLILVGKCKEEFSKFPVELSGGPLSFEAYLYWNPKIAPTEHQGSLIRINGSSGTLFDPTFLRYQVQELTRLSQITCEIFVQEGLDSALNIDRESFNFAHPHAVFLTRWLHNALRQLTTTQKRLASEVRQEVRNEIKEQYISGIQKISLDVWKSENKDEYSTPPTIKIQNKDQVENRQANFLDLEADIVVTRSTSEANKRTGPRVATQNSIIDEKAKAITQVLAAFGLLESLSKKQQERLLSAIYLILETSE